MGRDVLPDQRSIPGARKVYNRKSAFAPRLRLCFTLRLWHSPRVARHRKDVFVRKAKAPRFRQERPANFKSRHHRSTFGCEARTVIRSQMGRFRWQNPRIPSFEPASNLALCAANSSAQCRQAVPGSRASFSENDPRRDFAWFTARKAGAENRSRLALDVL